MSAVDKEGSLTAETSRSSEKEDRTQSLLRSDVGDRCAVAFCSCTDKIGQEAGQPVCHCHSAVDRGPKQQQLRLDDDSRDEMADAAKLTQCCEAA